MKPTDDEDRPATPGRRPDISNDELFLMGATESEQELRALKRARTLLELCDSAITLEPELREWFLSRACGDDHELRNDVRALLEAIDESCGFLSTLSPQPNR